MLFNVSLMANCFGQSLTEGIVDVHNDPPLEWASGEGAGGVWVQPFTPNLPTLTGVDIALGVYASEGAYCKVEIRERFGNSTGPVLTSKERYLFPGRGYYHFSFSPPVKVTLGKQYLIVLYGTMGSRENIVLLALFIEKYWKGPYLMYLGSNGTLTPYGGQYQAELRPALFFRTYGLEAMPTSVASTNTETSVNVLELDATEAPISSAVIDSDGGYAYFGTFTQPGVIAKVRLADFKQIDALTLNQEEGNLYASAIDSVHGFAYFAVSTTPIPAIVKIRLSDLARVDTFPLNSSRIPPSTIIIDPVNAFAYFDANYDPAVIVKAELSDFKLVETLKLNKGEDFVTTGVIDYANGFGYFGAASWTTNETSIVKVMLSDFTRVGALTMPASSGYFSPTSSIIDDASGFAYFGTANKPTKVLKIRLSNLSLVDTLIIDENGTGAKPAVIDSAHGFAYFGTMASNKIVRIRLSDFVVDGTLPLRSDMAFIHSSAAVMDTINGFVYFGTGNYILKVGADAFSRISSTTRTNIMQPRSIPEYGYLIAILVTTGIILSAGLILHRKRTGFYKTF